MNAWLVHCVKNSVNEKREKYAVEFCFVSFLSFHFIRIFLFLFVWWHFVSFILCQIRPSLRFKFARTLLRSVIFQSQCRSRVKIIGGAHHERQSHEVLGSPGECSSGKFLLGGPGPPRPLPTLRH